MLMAALLNAIAATVIVSLISLIGLSTLVFKRTLLRKLSILLVGLSAGALMGGAFLHLIPESAGELRIETVSMIVIAGFALFFILERVLHWHHCHKNEGECDVHMFTYMNLIGDSVHNLFDGMVIAAAFVADTGLGVITTLAVITHEIPQELGDFGVLIHGGFSVKKALGFNFLTALTAVLGAVIGFLLSSAAALITPVLVAFAAGGFIYIAASDLIPELHKEPRLAKSMSSYIFFLAGIALMYLIKLFFA